jgi:hypothetical protein
MRGVRRRRAGTLALAAGGAAAALVAALLAAAPVASPAARAGCSVPRNLTGFHGQFSTSFAKSTSGPIPGTQTTKTISLSRSATLQLRAAKIPNQLAGGVPVVFSAHVTGGTATVRDSAGYNPGDVALGDITDSGRPTGGGLVGLFSKVCQYQLLVTFFEKTSFSGDASITPSSHVQGTAATPRRTLPSSLKLAGSAGVSAYYSGACTTGGQSIPEALPDVQGCYEFGGGWAVDFETLYLCGATSGGTCGPEDEAQGTAQVSWSLTPIYAPKKKAPKKKK